MKPATWPRPVRGAERLMVLDPETGDLIARTVSDLPSFLEPNDLVVVNDAATLPASFACVIRGGDAEIRLAGFEGGTRFQAIVFGQGDHRMPTEARGVAPVVSVGELLALGPSLEARVARVDSTSPRLIEIELLGSPDRIWSQLVSIGKPIQYAYVAEPLALYDVQTVFASRPWAVEMPSAARPLDWRLLGELRRRGVKVATITHGAGLSSTGDPTLDARLPLRERYEIPEDTVALVSEAKARGARVVAIGTSVVRALEASARAGGGTLRPGSASTELRIDEKERPWVVDAILTGMHEPGTSHFELLEGFAPRASLLAACDLGTREGFLLHEFGDSMLVVRSRKRRLPEAA